MTQYDVYVTVFTLGSIISGAVGLVLIHPTLTTRKREYLTIKRYAASLVAFVIAFSLLFFVGFVASFQQSDPYEVPVHLIVIAGFVGFILTNISWAIFYLKLRLIEGD